MTALRELASKWRTEAESAERRVGEFLAATLSGTKRNCADELDATLAALESAIEGQGRLEAQLKDALDSLDIIARNVRAGAVHTGWCGDYAEQRAATIRASLAKGETP